MSKITSVIDIGSNSARLAVFSKTSRFGFHLLYEMKSRVRISEGSYDNGGYLQEAPMDRTIGALAEFKNISERLGARKLLCVATSALRDAPNSREFTQRVKRDLKINIKIIDGKQEAFYGALACSNLSHTKDGITLDIGGGSTECALIKDGKIVELLSLNIGTIRLKELFFDREFDIKGARDFINAELDKIPNTYNHKCVIGIGGTIRALTKIIMRSSKNDFIHGFEIDYSKYSSFFEKVYSASEDKLYEIGFTEDRIDNIRSGTLILDLFVKKFGASSISVSGVGVREGVFLNDLLRGQNLVFPTNFNPSLKSISDRFISKQNDGENIKKQALELFDTLKALHRCDDAYKLHMAIASKFALLGGALSPHNQSSHSSYLLYNALEYGFSNLDRLIVKILVEFSNKKIPKELPFASPNLTEFGWLSFIISVAKILRFHKGEYELISSKTPKLNIYSNSVPQIYQDAILKLHRPSNLDIEFIPKKSIVAPKSIHLRVSK